MANKPIHTLLPQHVSAECQEALNALHEAAQAGEVIGTAAIVMLPRGRYFIDIAGAARRDPVLTLGMAFMLAEELRTLAAKPGPHVKT